jgi:hypothetical protein
LRCDDGLVAVGTSEYRSNFVTQQRFVKAE